MNRTSRIKSVSSHQRNASSRWGAGSPERYVLFAPGWYYPEIHRGVVRFARDHQWHVTADFDDLVPKHWQGDGVIAAQARCAYCRSGGKPAEYPPT